MIPWYRRTFGREHMELYAHRDISEARANIQALVKLLSLSKDEPLLDLGCGAGRHLRALREMGFSQLVGMDLSKELLQIAAKILANSSVPSGDDVRLVRADMRAIPCWRCFATVLSLFTSFGYFDKDEENQAVFVAVYNSLRPGGTFLIDYMNRDYVVSHLVERDDNILPDRHIRNVRCLTDDGRRVEKTTTVTIQTGARNEFHESVRLYSATEMAHMLNDAGFKDVRRYGSLNGQDFDPKSERLIMIGVRRNE